MINSNRKKRTALEDANAKEFVLTTLAFIAACATVVETMGFTSRGVATIMFALATACYKYKKIHWFETLTSQINAVCDKVEMIKLILVIKVQNGIANIKERIKKLIHR